MFDKSSVISVSSDRDITPTNLNKSITMKYHKEARPLDSSTMSEKNGYSDKSFASRLKGMSKIYSEKSYDKRKNSVHSQNDSRTYFNDEMSLNSSCMEDLANISELKHLNSYDRNFREEDMASVESFTRILEVDEEYIGSNCNTGREHKPSNSEQINMISPSHMNERLITIPSSLKKPPAHSSHYSVTTTASKT
jgi:hypothetical protein